MKASGNILFQDEYQQVYHIEWATVGLVIDFTSTIGTPYVWGEEQSGYIQDGALFNLGIVTITRQVIRPFEGGYEVVAEGVSQYEDYIQTSFPCQAGPVDPFVYHLDRPFVDEVETVVLDGSHWADPDNSDDDEMVWAYLDPSGDPVVSAGTGLEFVDVWSN